VQVNGNNLKLTPDISVHTQGSEITNSSQHIQYINRHVEIYQTTKLIVIKETKVVGNSTAEQSPPY